PAAPYAGRTGAQPETVAKRKVLGRLGLDAELGLGRKGRCKGRDRCDLGIADGHHLDAHRRAAEGADLFERGADDHPGLADQEDLLGALVDHLDRRDVAGLGAERREDHPLSAAVHGATHASSSPLRSAIAMSPARRTFAYSASGVFLMNPLRVAMTRCSDEPFSRSATSAETRSPVCMASRMFWIGVPFAVRL